MKSINIKGKEYITVNERLKHFRSNEKYLGYSLVSELVENKDGVVIFKATISDASGRVVATGHAHEIEGSSNINSTSHIENGETSSWGRALANLGVGVDTSVASAEEVIGAESRAQIKQEAPSPNNMVRRIAPGGRSI
jgi:hypothetical protein